MTNAIPAKRFLTTPSGKINFRNALARRRFMRRQFRGAGYGKHICAAALRTDLRNEAEDRASSPMIAAADAVDTVLLALGIDADRQSRAFAIRAYHEGRAAILCSSRNCLGSSIFADDVNEGCIAEALEFLSRHRSECDRHVPINDAGANFLIRARASVANSSISQKAA